MSASLSVTAPTQATANFGVTGPSETDTCTLTNNGNVSDTFNLSFTSSQGWTYVFLDAGNAPISSVTLAPGASAPVNVRLTVPAGISVGTVEVGVMTATGQAFPAATDNATDVTTITAGNLSLSKSVSPSGDGDSERARAAW